MLQRCISMLHASKGLEKQQMIRLAMKGGSLCNLSIKEENSFLSMNHSSCEIN